jgi:hypothetical protein
MKLRIKGNSLRLRVSPSEVARLFDSGRVEETIQFAAQPDAGLTYALECGEDRGEVFVRYRPQEVTVVLPATQARSWAEGDQVGIYGESDVGGRALTLAVEKDFACLDDAEQGNQDTFPNPGKSC